MSVNYALVSAFSAWSAQVGGNMPCQLYVSEGSRFSFPLSGGIISVDDDDGSVIFVDDMKQIHIVDGPNVGKVVLSPEVSAAVAGGQGWELRVEQPEPELV